MAVSPNDPEQNRELAEGIGARFAILSDPDMTVTDSYGIRHVSAMAGTDLPFPSTFVVAADGTLSQKFTNANYKERPEPADVLAAVRAAVG